MNRMKEEEREKKKEKERVRASVIVVYMAVVWSRECANVQGMCFR